MKAPSFPARGFLLRQIIQVRAAFENIPNAEELKS